MRIVIFVIVIILSGCKKETVNFGEDSLIDTWNRESGEKFERWTFDPETLYVEQDSVASCEQPDRTRYGSRYKIENNAFQPVFQGHSHGLIPPPTYHIALLTNKELVLRVNGKYLQFEKCN